MGFKLNPDAVEFFPVSGHRRGKRADWRWTSVSKQQIPYARGDERCGRRRVGLLNPLGGETHKQGMYLDRWTKQKLSNRKKSLARKDRRRARPERRRNAKTSQNVDRARSRTGEINVATWNVRSLPLTGRRGAGHAEVLLQKYKVLDCDFIGLQDCKVIGSYVRDTRVRDSNGTSLLRFAGDNKVALVNTFFSVPKGCTSRTLNGTRPANRKRIDYIITRQSYRKLVRNVTVHLQPHADSDHNIVSARVRLPGRFARNRKQRAPTGRKSIDRRAITSDTDRRERRIQLVASQLTQTELRGLGGTVDEKATLFTDTPLRSAEEVMPGQIRQSRIFGLLENEAMHYEFEEA